MPTEIELKLALDPAAMPLLLRHRAVRAVRRGRLRTAHVAGAYFDTPDSLLAAADVALRVRRVGSRWVQTIKGPPGPGAGGGMSARVEHEWPLARPTLDVALLSATPWRKLIASAPKHGGLAPCFTTEFERRTVPLRFPDGTLALLCVDRGEIRATSGGRSRRARIAEIEIELEAGTIANVYDLALALCADLPVAVMTTSKAARGHALRRGERDQFSIPVKARAVALTADMTAADALATIVRACLEQIAANAPGLLADDDPEWVHQMRVGTRRLRSCLALVARHAPTAALDSLRAEVKWLANALGPARDWDVFTHETLPPLAARLVQDNDASAGLKRLRARALARRRTARAAARAAVASPRFHAMLLAGGRLCATPRFGAATFAPFPSRSPATSRSSPPSPSPSPASSVEPAPAAIDPLGGSAPDFARRLLARRHRKLRDRAAALATASPEERHAARIAAKRLRYVAEFFAPLYPGKRVRAYLKAMSALQDVLGHANDTATALRLASETGGRGSEVAVGALRGWIAAQAAALEPELVDVARRFADAKPFWPRRDRR